MWLYDQFDIIKITYDNIISLYFCHTEHTLVQHLYIAASWTTLYGILPYY